jgi:hypothetical protein
MHAGIYLFESGFEFTKIIEFQAYLAAVGPVWGEAVFNMNVGIPDKIRSTIDPCSGERQSIPGEGWHTNSRIRSR